MSDQPASNASDSGTDRWPRLLCIRPRSVVLSAACFLVIMWVIFVAVDLIGVKDLSDSNPDAYSRIFNDRPVEWAQWVVLLIAVLGGGFVAGRLWKGPHHNAALFYAFLAAGLGLMLLEEAGDIRHTIGDSMATWTDDDILGLDYRTITDVPFFAVIAALPMYALIRYGRAPWRAVRARPYLIGAYGLYAIIGAANGLREEFYIGAGEFVNSRLFGGRFPGTDGPAADWYHYFLMDSVIEETVELLAASCMLALVVGFVSELRMTSTVERKPDWASEGDPAAQPDRS